MKIPLYILTFLLFLSLNSFSQGFMLSKPVLHFTGQELHIGYDLISKKEKGHYYVWVETSKSTGEKLDMKALQGDFGEKIQPGSAKRIVWLPSKDNVFLSEEVYVEVKAEKYEKSFNRTSVLLRSVVFPGLGQTKASKGKPWWLTGVVSYGLVAGGVYQYSAFQKTYNSYRTEEDMSLRAELLNKAQKESILSNALLISGAAIWSANILWAAFQPNRYQPLKYAPVSFKTLASPGGLTGSLAFTYKF